MPFRPSNYQLSQTLRAARILIVAKREKFICIALQEVGCRDIKLAPSVRHLRNYITKRLGRSTTLEDWQNNRSALRYRHPAHILKDRLAWIDWMIANLKEEK